MAVSLSPFAGAGWQFFDNNGVILSGGKLYIYAAGTTSSATTYTSVTGSTANTNPIILNSSGRLANEIWLTTGLNYKFILKTSADVLIGTWDNIPAGTTDVADLQAALASSTGAGMIGYTQGGTAVATTVQAKLRETVSVFDFMTAAQVADVQAGTASIDVKAAIQAAIDSLSNGGEVFFPVGKYLISSTINITASKTGITLRGTNGAAIWNGATYVYEAGSVIIKKSTMTTEGIKSLGLRLCITDLAMSGQTGNTGDGIYIEDGQSTVLTNVSVAKVGGNGIRIGSKGPSGNVNGWMLNSVTTEYCGDNGVYIYDQYDIANPNANGGTATGLVTQGNISSGLHIVNGMYNTFNGLLSQQNLTYGVTLERVAGHTVGYYTTFIVSDIEANTSGSWYIDTTYPLHINYIGTSIGAPNIDPGTTYSSIIHGGKASFRGVRFSTSGSDLDYYKTATWTPADSSGASLTFTLVNCKYTRVGNLVTCCGRITYPATANGNQAKFTLPFTANQGSFSISSNYGTAIFGYTSGSDAYIYGAGQSTITNANLSGKELDITISYLTT